MTPRYRASVPAKRSSKVQGGGQVATTVPLADEASLAQVSVLVRLLHTHVSIVSPDTADVTQQLALVVQSSSVITPGRSLHEQIPFASSLQIHPPLIPPWLPAVPEVPPVPPRPLEPELPPPEPPRPPEPELPAPAPEPSSSELPDELHALTSEARPQIPNTKSFKSSPLFAKADRPYSHQTRRDSV